jgi:hypothetical protein
MHSDAKCSNYPPERSTSPLPCHTPTRSHPHFRASKCRFLLNSGFADPPQIKLPVLPEWNLRLLMVVAAESTLLADTLFGRRLNLKVIDIFIWRNFFWSQIKLRVEAHNQFLGYPKYSMGTQGFVIIKRNGHHVAPVKIWTKNPCSLQIFTLYL